MISQRLRAKFVMGLPFWLVGVWLLIDGWWTPDVLTEWWDPVGRVAMVVAGALNVVSGFRPGSVRLRLAAGSLTVAAVMARTYILWLDYPGLSVSFMLEQLCFAVCVAYLWGRPPITKTSPARYRESIGA